MIKVRFLVTIQSGLRIYCADRMKCSGSEHPATRVAIFNGRMPYLFNWLNRYMIYLNIWFIRVGRVAHIEYRGKLGGHDPQDLMIVRAIDDGQQLI